MSEDEQRRAVGGPWFEDLAVGQVFDDAPALTITDGHAAVHQALVGDRLRLALDADLCREVTGAQTALAHPSLVCDVAIGQSTGPSRRVRGNLFYRGLVLQRQVFIGDTLRTRTEIVGLKQNRPRGDGGPLTGLVAMRIRTENQHGEHVLDFWRCPMIPLREGAQPTDRADPFDGIPQTLDPAAVAAAAPAGWDLRRYREAVPGGHAAALRTGDVFAVEGRETVTGETELARLTLNVAYTHTDAGSSAHGRRLAYGGHTIAIAAAHTTRALPELVTIVAWHGCDHTGPVFAGDILSTEIAVGDVRPLEGGGALADLEAIVHADRGDGEPPARVLDWRFIGLLA